ncbi:MAG: hypothetical protein ABSH00_00050 [Bryobacteraceae bacterium]|jgi:hypothetical protein
MEKHILSWSYWLGLVCTVICFVLRFLNAIGVLVPQPVKQGNTMGYISFLHAAALFFLIAIATASYIWAHSQRSQ